MEYSTYPDSSSCSDLYLSTAYPTTHTLPSSFLSPALTPASLTPRLVAYRASMQHKCNLTLVSKTWHQYALPVLYASIWISRSAQAQALALTLLCQAYCLPPPSSSSSFSSPSSTSRIRARTSIHSSAGRFIRRLRIETPALERCNPADLRSILDYASALEVYEDYRSVRRVAGAADLLGALAQGGGLRALSWTNYDDPGLVGLGMELGMGLGLGGRLEYLELNFVSSSFSPTTTTTKPLPLGSPDPAKHLSLPALATLKVTLDNATFAVLSTWDMPALRNLSVVSADFAYAGEGFRRFLGVHGKELRQLEVGHSSVMIEEVWLTAPPPPAAPAPGLGAAAGAGGGAGGSGGHSQWEAGFSLAEWCPHLEEFVCSADAAWDWHHPDWIAPHLLLPSHPNVVLIGIRGIGGRMRGDWARAMANQHMPTQPHHTHAPPAGAQGQDGDTDTAFFGLRAQVESLLRREAFPRLRYVRDLSEGSDRMRRGWDGLSRSYPSSYLSFSSSSSSSLAEPLSRRSGHEEREDARERETVVRFWEGVLGRCREEGVWLEDFNGWNVTSGSLRRARAGVEMGMDG